MSDIMGNEKDQHDWKRGESLQWGALGLPRDFAQTPYQCEKCRKSFTHFYNQEPNIYAAMEAAGIDSTSCGR